MAVDRGPEPDEPGYRASLKVAAGRHNEVLKVHNAFPNSTGSVLYVICQCQKFKGTWAMHEDHCQRVVIDAEVVPK